MADLTDLAALDAAINSGVRVVQFKDRRTEYQSTSDMLKARTRLANELTGAGLLPTPIRQYRMRTESGF